MKALGAMSFLLLIASSAMLAGVVVFTPGDFRARRQWRLSEPMPGKHIGHSGRIHTGRAFCLVLLRLWQAALALTVVFFLGAGFLR
jgi:hypothetical protein